ncbi:hypothetical protein UlMin_001524 [Ulmus minor]
MGFTLGKKVCLLGLVLLLPALCTSQFIQSRATYYGSPDCYGTPTGACGFGEYGRTVNDGMVSGVSRLYKNGSGCGACYQVRCKNEQHCSDEGTYVVVTDYGEGDNTDFILSPRAYGKLARPEAQKDLFAFGVVDVEYRRVSCKYPGYNNIMIKVHEHSKYPDYLAIVIFYVAGQNDIVGVDLWRKDYQEWWPMRRAYGVVWDMANLPGGPIKLRIHSTSSAGVAYSVQSANEIPNDWKVGATYDSNVQIN